MGGLDKLLLAVVIANKQTLIFADIARLITFYRLIDTNPQATPEEMENEHKRLMDEMLVRVEAVVKPTPRSAYKEALLYFAEQL